MVWWLPNPPNSRITWYNSTRWCKYDQHVGCIIFQQCRVSVSLQETFSRYTTESVSGHRPPSGTPQVVIVAEPDLHFVGSFVPWMPGIFSVNDRTFSCLRFNTFPFYSSRMFAYQLLMWDGCDYFSWWHVVGGISVAAVSRCSDGANRLSIYGTDTLIQPGILLSGTWIYDQFVVSFNAYLRCMV